MIVIADLDGTLAQCDDRIHFIRDPATGQMRPAPERDWTSFHAAGCHAPLYRNVRWTLWAMYHAGVVIDILTGRPEPFREGTERWLRECDIFYRNLIMRGTDDRRSDVTYKGEILAQYRPAQVMAILEDRDAVVAMARGMGFTVFQVNAGAF